MCLLNSQNKQIFSDHFVNVRGYKTRYWDVGFSNSVVILIHGFGLSCDIWHYNMTDLSRFHRVVAIDFWGSGKTDATKKKFTTEEYAEFLLWFMDALKIQKAKIVGHSLGGLIALQIASNHPEYVEKVMLVGSAGFTTKVPWHFRLLVLPCVGEYFAKPNKLALKQAMSYNTYLKNPALSELTDSLFEYSKKPHAVVHMLNLARSGVSIFGFKRYLIRKITNNIHKIRCPVFALWGKNDKILNYRSAFRAKKLIPHANIKILEKCGHLPQIEYPEQFNEITHSFLTSE